MPVATPSTTRSRHWNSLLITACLLALLLGSLFYQSFIPQEVVFSNDGPLGGLIDEQNQLPQTFTGLWVDLNSIGSNAGMVAPCISSLLRLITGPVGYAKFFAPVALFILGIGAWTFFRQLKLATLAAILGALAAVLTSTLFSDACWGVASHQIAFGMDFLAMALIVSNSPPTPSFVRWVRLALAGFAVGINVVEAADIGAIFSLFVAAFALFQSLVEDGTPVKKIGRGVARITVIAAFAAFFAYQTVISLVGTQIEGIVGMGQSDADKAAHWDYATQWSLPKIETFGIIVPGLFGYRMDTPDGGAYWGAVGRNPGWDRYFASGENGSPPPPPLRFYGTGNYAGTLVLLVALWAIAQSLRRKDSVFSTTHRQFLWFWTAVLLVSVLLAFGRFAPFYALPYKLPYFSTIRNPVKFLFVFSWALVTVFAYGIHGLSRRYLEIPATGSASPLGQLKAWWTKTRGFDRNWTSTCFVVFIGSLLAWLIYALQRPNLATYLQMVGFPDEGGTKGMADVIAAFSIRQIGWFILFFVLAMGLLTLILSGAFAGRRGKWGGILLGILLVLDLGRADLPWIVYWNYPQKYASNPIVDILRNQPYEHRVAVLHSNSLFENLYDIEWSQQIFPYYNIQSLDVIQMPRLPEDLAAYQAALAPRGTPDTAYLIARRWELTNTRYLLGPAGYLDALNQQLDPMQQRFRIIQRFDVVSKPGIEHAIQLSELTALPTENGECALLEFTGALPRAKLYSQWQISTNDSDTLQMLASKNFDAWRTVLVSTPLPASPTINTTNENSGTVEFKGYAPKDLVFNTRAEGPSVLLLNDKYDPNWHVFVDGKPAPLLRCNFIMRGVYLTPGVHTVEFKFSLPLDLLYVSLSAIGVGILLCGFLMVSTRRMSSK
ncbi:MAG TPA: hypothetical protein VN784_18310 [Candidatus Limnocylindrales bacterium]|nr:hypothetical protein [Candidatus Limnocylindrales bacterium]